MTDKTVSWYGPADLIQLDPRTLETHQHNLRAKQPAAKDVAELTASILDAGVLVPLIVAPRSDDEGYTIIAGHRRAVAAVAAGLDTVPCLVRVSIDSAESATRAMLSENVNRRNLTAAEEADGYKQLSMLGIAVGDIALASGRDTATIAAAIEVASSPRAKAVAHKYDLTMVQAIGLSELEDDKEAVKALTVVAKTEPAQFDHALAQAKDRRERQLAIEAKQAELVESGVKILEKRPSTYDGKTRRLDSLQSVTGKGTMTVAGHKKCPGHAAFVGTDYRGQVYVEFGCEDYANYGHKQTGFSGGGGATSREMSDEEKAQRTTRRTAATAMRVASKVRLQFVVDLLESPRKMAKVREPIMTELLRCSFKSLEPSAKAEQALFSTFTGIEAPAQQTYMWEPPHELVRNATTPAEVARVALILIATDNEARIGSEQLYGPTRDYLGLLISAGYAPAPIEQILIAKFDGTEPPALELAIADDDDDDEEDGGDE